MNYLMKAIACFLGHSLVFRFLSLLFKAGLIDGFSAITTAIILIILSTSFFLLWHSNHSLNTNIINFIAISTLIGVVIGITI